MKRIVIALGGNAMDTTASGGNLEGLFLEEAFRILNKKIRENETVLTYGNGPQVGNIYDAGNGKYNIGMAGAMSQGMLSSIICNAYDKIKYETGSSKDIAPIFTRTVVNENSYSLKPVGRYYQTRVNGSMMELPGRGYRMAVRSPEPVDILEKSAILSLLSDGYIPLAAGGGGMPVIKKLQYYSTYQGVVDKDLASSLLGTLISADNLIIITNVDYIYLNFGKKNQEKLEKISYGQMLEYYNTLNFEEGTIKPKIRAALDFIRKGGKSATIASLKSFATGGTIIEN
ncbi:MAG: carbamate kinase [Ferroplasma sp.]